MTREEAAEILRQIRKLNEKWCGTKSTCEAFDMAIKSLCPITREQVEKMRGEWKIYLNGNYNDEIYYCNVCGCDLDALARSHSFCSACGSPMTDKAVDILWKRLEAMQNAAD